MNIDLFDINSLLNDEEKAVQDSVSRFVKENVDPVIQECFENHEFPSELIKPLADLGLFGTSIDGYGCPGMNSIIYGLICKELEKGDSGMRSFVSVQSSLVMYPIYAFGSEEQKQEWLPKLASAEAIGCFGLTESQGGSDPSNMKTHAKKDGDDWIINGSKMWITNGSIADVAVIWAHTDEGIRGFIVDTKTKGFVANKIENKFSLRASITSELFFDNIRVSKDSVLPGVIGLKGPLSCLTQARYGISWGVIGAAESCLEELLEYTQTRILFDRSLDENQAIQIRLADMQRRIVTSSLLSYRLGQLKDLEQMNPTQVSLAKWNNVRMALDVARDCRDMLGGSGISAEYVPIRHMLNLESVVTYEGTETIHQLAVGRSLTGKSAF
ncbi:MAG: acyl-CoA dehydrogenase family protein [Gammaproteobacteria bacterium]|nr:acyl-CoA dehydrogenase [Gammaproteobacteria bacterium]OUX40832.1 MAG: acyl-CoA dehydrogenase [Rickettsiales bacterium TMED269]MBF42599.1 acyl-CoA dehydrogenase [Gammaproteobacteria bacterium]MCH1529899.1 acyl-CoA dehydrogenase family protein [Gammaproteobacteria bacterium]MDC3239950.1 acyl-CoA dehydrogenase family protein [Gammaproteobacteria bacterium]|tara:strand:- start:1146 stop:2297 length:1152 start_codon:yes stop_codon:yes gene_type:complete